MDCRYYSAYLRQINTARRVKLGSLTISTSTEKIFQYWTRCCSTFRSVRENISSVLWNNFHIVFFLRMKNKLNRNVSARIQRCSNRRKFQSNCVLNAAEKKPSFRFVCYHRFVQSVQRNCATFAVFYSGASVKRIVSHSFNKQSTMITRFWIVDTANKFSLCERSRIDELIAANHRAKQTKKIYRFASLEDTISNTKQLVFF